MADLKVLKTAGTDQDIISKSEVSPIHLFITSLDSCKTDVPHELGDILLNSDSNEKYALLIREDANDKMNVAVLRVAIIRFLKHLLENDVDFSSIVINRHQFKGQKEISTFIATVQELLMTYFGEVIENDVNLVITNYDESRGINLMNVFNRLKSE